VNQPLDPGYAAAAARRGPHPPRRWYDTPAVALGCLLIGFTLVVAYVHTHRAAPAAAKVHSGLVTRVRDAERQDSQLQAQLQSLTGQLAQVRAQAGIGALSGKLQHEQVLAGETEVTGPGVEVVLSDPAQPTATPTTARAGSEPINAAFILTDRDVRSVVNQLWSDGAEAISVNDVRLTPASAIRFAGQAVLVDFVPITSPYTIRAVGNADQLDTGFAASPVASRYHTLSSADGIGFSFTERRAMTLPAAAPASTRYATTPAATPSGARR
jgi:uncharacterized protein YlxW (UPF0749 family)